MSVRAISGGMSRTGRQLAPAVRVRGYSMPAPVAGWNARDALSNMKEEDATILDNWFPDEAWLSVRKGYVQHADGCVSAVESLMSWAGPSGAPQLFAAAGSSIFNATTSATVGAADITGMNNARWQHTMFGTSAGNFLYIVNGSNDPRYYNGTTWTVPTLTGGTGADMIHVNAFKRRLFFIEKNSLSFWYLPVVSVAGALTEFPLASLCAKGGYLMAMGTWTRDGGSGVDDFAVFVTSEGEVIIYQGDDPGNLSAWFLVGVFQIAPPIGRRCMFKFGSDMIVITEDGFSQLSRFLSAGRASERAAMSDRIQHAIHGAVSTARDRFGWQPIFYPSSVSSPMVIFNIPVGASSVQFVSNATTGAWCRFTGMNANCWEVHNDKLYFGGAGTVYQADRGLSDNGAEIETRCQQAYSYFGDRTRRKRFAMARPNFVLDGAITVSIRANVDFESITASDSASFSDPAGSPWDTSDWDTSSWSDDPSISRDWQTVVGLGHCAGLRLKTLSSNGSIRWNSTDWLYEPTASAGYL